MIATIIVATNAKGGVGKTTNILNLAVTIAKTDKKAKTLVVDLDPQAHVTLGFAPGKTFPEETYIDSRLNKVTEHIKDPKISLYERPQRTNYPRIDIIPSRKKLFEITETNLLRKPRWEQFLHMILNEHIEEYDIILIDTAASFSQLHTLAIGAADYYFVPMRPEAYSVEGYELTREIVKEKKQENGTENPKFIGYVLNGGTERDEGLNWIRSYFAQEKKNLCMEIPQAIQLDKCRRIENAEKPSIFDFKNQKALAIQKAYIQVWQTMYNNMMNEDDND